PAAASQARSSRRVLARPKSIERPLRVLAQERVRVVDVPGCSPRLVRPTDVAHRDKRVPAQISRIVPRDVEPVVALDEPLPVCLEPFDEGNRRLSAGGQRFFPPPPLDAAVPRTDVLADVAAVDAVLEPRPVLDRDRG